MGCFYVSSSSLIQILPALIFHSNFVNLIDGSTSYSPVLRSKRQSWQGQTIIAPSRFPPAKPQPMCGHRLSIAKIWPCCLINKIGRPSTDTSFLCLLANRFHLEQEQNHHSDPCMCLRQIFSITCQINFASQMY